MSEKSYVTMEQHQCFVCGVMYDTGALLLDKHLQKKFNQHTLTGTGLCPEHQKLKDEGYIALIVANEATKQRTGVVIHVRSESWENLFINAEIPSEGVAFITEDAAADIEALVAAKPKTH